MEYTCSFRELHEQMDKLVQITVFSQNLFYYKKYLHLYTLKTFSNLAFLINKLFWIIYHLKCNCTDRKIM